MLSWIYLLWLNSAYYILFCRFLGEKKEAQIYETKKLICDNPESSDAQKYTVDELVNKLSTYNVISFDIFDTLILRPVDAPVDVFALMANRIGLMDFKNLRIQMEAKARENCKKLYGHTEIKLSNIWDLIEQETGVSSEEGMRVEIETECAMCFANPFMLDVWNRLLSMGKRLIVVSDMYLPLETLVDILRGAGYAGIEKLYLSCEYGRNKVSGTLFQLVKDEYSGLRMVHVGDNPHSDYKQAKKYGFDAILYQNVNRNDLLLRAHDMSSMVGSAYRGIINSHIYNGVSSYNMEYEYGFIYGGLFVLGYCDFIHEYCVRNDIDHILFLSRDGDILKQAYDYLYPAATTRYAYWSRKAATKLEFFYDRHDYYRRFLYHKVNQNITIRDVLWAMELQGLYGIACESKLFNLDDELSSRNVKAVKSFCEQYEDVIISTYRPQLDAAETYYKDMLANSKKVLAVDIGWAGSGAMSLRYLIENIWDIDCELIGMIAGTNTLHNAEPDASEPFLQSGKLVAYLYSQSHNRDLLKKHNPNKDYNIFWEILLSSPTPQFKGFYKGNRMEEEHFTECVAQMFRYDENLDITLEFGSCDKNVEGIRQVQRGILDFVQSYYEHFCEFPYMLHVSGRDAYAPMLVAASHDEKYLRGIEKKFGIEIHVG